MASFGDLSTDIGAFAERCLGRSDRRRLERLLDGELVDQWRRTAIPVRTGALKRALTQRSSPDRSVNLRLLQNGARVDIEVIHPRPDLVPYVDVMRALRIAWAQMVEEAR